MVPSSRKKKFIFLFYFCEFAFAGGELREEGTRAVVREWVRK
jgi:hypothetical protein